MRTNYLPSKAFKIPALLLFLTSLLFLHASGEAAPPNQVEVLIRFHKAPGKAEKAAVTNQGGRIDRTFKIVPAVKATVPEASLARLRNDKSIAAVELDAAVHGHDINNTWGAARIGCATLQDGTFDGSGVAETGAGVRVAVIDSGIDYGHGELMMNYAGGYDFVNNDSDPMDDNGHGTHVSGTVAASLNLTGIVGVAPDVHLFGLKVLGADGGGSYSAIISALDWCVANNIQVANLSLGSAGDPGSIVKAAFDNAEAAGISVISSAGNSGEGSDTVGYPAKYPSVIAVASTTSSDGRSSFSSTGPDVEIAAPGSSIYSTVIGGGFGYKSGTSMAAPHVAGVAALLIGVGITDQNADGKINDDVRQMLADSAEDLGASGRDNYFGHGLVDAETSVLLVKAFGGGGDPDPVFDAPSDLTGTLSGSTVSLSWADNSDVENSFEIQYGLKVKKSVSWADWASVPADSTAFANTLPAGTYRFRVRAIQDSPYSATAWSNEIQIKIGGSTGGGGGGSGGGGGKGKKP